MFFKPPFQSTKHFTVRQSLRSNDRQRSVSTFFLCVFCYLNAILDVKSNFSGFDYRPFVLNWCMSVKIIDDFMVNPIESLKAEWLYSQGRGRQFRIGEQADLARYLSSVCPLSGEVLENENERKLRLILSKGIVWMVLRILIKLYKTFGF